MKITKIKIIEVKHRPLMNGLELRFNEQNQESIDANCLIGVNGSGKSQFLETIAEIFLFLDSQYRKIDRVVYLDAPLLFEIEYIITVDNKTYQVEIIQNEKKVKSQTLNIYDKDGKIIKIDNDKVENFLPYKIIGYTSGENETISIPFHAYYDTYAEHTAKRAIEKANKEDYEPRFYFMDYNTSLGIAISNLVFEETKRTKHLKEELNIKALKSFQIVIQTKQPAAPKIRTSTGETGVILTEDLKKWRDYLIKASTCYYYDEKYDKYILDFFVNDATKEALAFFFETAYDLYTALYKFELLNNLLIDSTTRKEIERERKERRLITKMPDVPNKDKVLHYSELKLELTNNRVIDYLSLSDGEHQFFNIFGTIVMVNYDNCLFLFDEPETHFNPKWRRLFVRNLNKLAEGKKQDFFITSHSPFIVSDSKRDSVYIFDRVTDNTVSVKSPDQETFGASFNNILKMAFSLEEVISEESLQVINALKNETDPQVIEEGLRSLGESPQILALYRRVELLSKNK